MNEEFMVCILALLLTGVRSGPSFEQVPPVVSAPYLEKRGVEGNDDSIPLKRNVFQSLLLSLLVVAGHHYV